MEYLICLGYGTFVVAIVLVRRAHKLGVLGQMANADARSGKRGCHGLEH
ncbi:MAG TPA: hypothetical protein VIF60_15150 [Burkholderiaceae bacterium]|jgi:hypothetical protein